ncbi:MAG TPA: amino acid ABC transporter substrate-binding protein [Alphaproteobacteria bacterium]|nr:amino acid ABC transporter substrate-binding protein [Alphaproteobacteria bacterium]
MKRWLMTIAALGVGLMAMSAAQAAEPVKIGFSISKTGLFAAGTGSQMDTYELWKDEVNAAGGLDVKGVKRPIVFDYYDDQSDPSKAVQIYEKLITQDKVDLLLAPWGTPMHIAVAGIAERYKFPIVGNSAASVKLREIKSNYMWFTTAEMPDRFAHALTALLKSVHKTKVALIANQLPFALEVRSYLVPDLEKAGFKIAVNEAYPPGIKDMTSLLTEVKAAKPDAVLALTYPADTSLYMKQARELGIDAPFQMVLIGATESWFPKEFGAAANGIVTMAHWAPRKEWPKAQAFFDAYEKKFHEAPDYLDSALAYMSCEILQQAVAKVGLDRVAIRNMIATHTFETINGPVKFKGPENITTPAGIVQIQGKNMELIWPPSIETAKFMPKPAWPAH